MEQLKRAKIIDTAIVVFRDKGYAAASMQDIAEACGMAKGSIYKHFNSKEDLFTEAFTACHQLLFAQAEELDRTMSANKLHSKERLRSKIELLMDYAIEYHLFLFDFKELPIKDNERFREAWKNKKATLLAWQRDCLMEAYGPSLQRYIWDAVAVFRGVLTEYLTHANQRTLSLSMAELAAFIVARLDAVVTDLIETAPEPVLVEANAYFHHLNPMDEQSRQQVLLQLLAGIQAFIQGLDMAERSKGELLEVAGLLQTQLEQESPNSLLTRVYMAYLDTQPELRPSIRQLKHML